MNTNNKKSSFEDALKNLESKDVEFISTIYESIKRYLREFEKQKEYRYELIAFEHYPNNGKNVGWKTYHGPYAFFNNGDGTVRAPFGQDEITKETIEYWKKRSFQSQNPMLYFRYADLVVDYHTADIYKTNDIYKYVDRHVDGIIEIARKIINKECSEDLSRDIFSTMKRCSELLLQFNKQERINELAKTCFELEKSVGTDELPGLWGYAAEIFILNKELSKKVENRLTSEIIKDMEERFGRINGKNKIEFSIAFEKVHSLLKRINT